MAGHKPIRSIGRGRCACLVAPVRMSLTCLVLTLTATHTVAGSRAQATPPPAPPCVTDRTPGARTFTCEGLRVDARIPARCRQPGCGLILEVHGDTGTGLLEDAHTRLMDRGDAAGYIVIAPTSPSATWRSVQDATLVAIVRDVAAAFDVDRKRIHVTGFSRGGFVTWRLACDYADLFASAAPAAAGTGRPQSESSCFARGGEPVRRLPILMLMGRTDRSVTLDTTTAIRDLVVARYRATTVRTIAGDAAYSHQRWTGPDGALLEVFEHGYENPPGGSWAGAKGHCIPGSPVDPHAPRYGLPCARPTAFDWGAEVLRFFQAHPMR